MANEQHPLHEEIKTVYDYIDQQIDAHGQKRHDSGEMVNPLVYVEAMLIKSLELITSPILAGVQQGVLSDEDKKSAIDMLMTAKVGEATYHEANRELTEEAGLPAVGLVIAAVNSLLPAIHDTNHEIYDEEHGITDNNSNESYGTSTDSSDDLKDILKQFLND